MDIYDSRYFIINKTLMTSVGLWPYQDPRIKFYIRIFSFCGLVAMLLPQVLALIKDFRLIDKMMEHLALMLLVSGTFLKFLTTIFAENKLKTVFESIINNWEKITSEEDRAILIHYSERGRQLTIGYIIYMIAATTFFILIPSTPMVLNKLKPLNESRPRLYILNGEFALNVEDHYGKIYIFDCLVFSMAVVIVVAVDTTYTVCMEHCVGLFAVIKFRLHTFTKFINNNEIKRKGDSYDFIIQIIQLHNEIINFTDILETSYSTSFFFLMGINMFIFSIVTVLVIIKLNEIMEFIRFILLLVGTVVHLFYVSWPGQKLIDHSSGLFEDSYTNEWYDCSTKAQILLKFITLRCLKPCQLTAGGIYVMNFANFLSIMKASMSYITMFSSFR